MARGSRYGIDRLVGPVTIDQNSYIDIAKANLHIGSVVPVPSVAGTGAVSTGNVAHPIPAGVNPGDIMRILGNSTAADYGTIQFFSALATDVTANALFVPITVRGGSEIFVIIPPNATHYQILTHALNNVVFILDN